MGVDLFTSRTSYYIINGVTAYRVAASLALLLTIIAGHEEIFRWLLALSFFTDAIDGYLARKYRVASAFGSRLDSIGDDLTVLMGIVGLLVFRTGFLQQHWPALAIMLTLFAIQLSFALYRYGKFSSFHTYLAKIAAILQGSFLILMFFLPSPPITLFYLAVAFTCLDLIEEIILVLALRQWRTDVKGWFWIKKRGQRLKQEERV